MQLKLFIVPVKNIGAAEAENLPHAAIVFDRFHITKLANEKLEALRREMVREATGLMKQTVKGICYLLLMRRDHIDEEKLPHWHPIGGENPS